MPSLPLYIGGNENQYRYKVDLVARKLLHWTLEMFPSWLRSHLSLKNLLTVVCGSLALFLIYQEFVTLTVTKPTTTSREERELETSDLPRVVVCLTGALERRTHLLAGMEAEMKTNLLMRSWRKFWHLKTSSSTRNGDFSKRYTTERSILDGCQ